MREQVLRGVGGGGQRLLAAGNQPPSRPRARGRPSALFPVPLRPIAFPGPSSVLTSLCAAHLSTPSYRAPSRFLSPIPSSAQTFPTPPSAAPTAFFCLDAPLPSRLVITRNRNLCRYLRVRPPPSLCRPTGVRTSGGPSVPPGAGADHAQRLPLPTSRVPVVHPGGTRKACPR